MKGRSALQLNFFRTDLPKIMSFERGRPISKRDTTERLVRLPISNQST